jgi:hypothetical protein
MKRRPIQMLLAALAVAVPTAAVASATVPPRASLARFECVHALDPTGRSVSATSVMRPVPGTRRAAVRFRLLKRDRGAATFQPVTGPGLGTWISKSFGQLPGDVWRVIHPVSDLAAPAAYRFAVSFRWIGSGGRVLARALRWSHVCRQPELRPDLEVLSISVQPDPVNAQAYDYGVRIRNAGVTGAGPFRVQLDDQGVLVHRRVWHLDGRTTRFVKLVGPTCQAAHPPTVTVDPGHRVDVWTRARATLTAVCPAAPASGSSASGG